VVYRPTPELLKRLEALESRTWDGLVWRHMFADNPPTRPNESGARWNPPGVPAIYCSLDRVTALAEGDHLVASQSLRPRVKRTIYNLRVHLEKVLDLLSRSRLLELGIGETELSDVDHAGCQRLGGTVEWLEHDGLLVPSARRSGVNLVIFTRKRGPGADFEIVSSEVLER
jgi:RES domain-containing protein